MLVESTGECPYCGHNTFVRYGSSGYYVFDMCPNCGLGFGENGEPGKDSDEAFEVASEVISAIGDYADYPSLSGLKRSAASENRKDEQRKAVFVYDGEDELKKMMESHYCNSFFSGHISIDSKHRIVETKIVMDLHGDRFEYRSNRDRGEDVLILNGVRQPGIKLRSFMNFWEGERNIRSDTPALYPILVKRKYIEALETFLQINDGIKEKAVVSLRIDGRSCWIEELYTTNIEPKVPLSTAEEELLAV